MLFINITLICMGPFSVGISKISDICGWTAFSMIFATFVLWSGQNSSTVYASLLENLQLRQYLLHNRITIDLSVQLLFSQQLSSAILYLHSCKYVHRDIAARNVLVSSPRCVKLSDFGLSRCVEEENFYTCKYHVWNIMGVSARKINCFSSNSRQTSDKVDGTGIDQLQTFQYGNRCLDVWYVSKISLMAFEMIVNLVFYYGMSPQATNCLLCWLLEWLRLWSCCYPVKTCVISVA